MTEHTLAVTIIDYDFLGLICSCGWQNISWETFEVPLKEINDLADSHQLNPDSEERT